MLKMKYWTTDRQIAYVIGMLKRIFETDGIWAYPGDEDDTTVAFADSDQPPILTCKQDEIDTAWNDWAKTNNVLPF